MMDTMASIGPTLILGAILGLALPAAARSPAGPRELGLVRWGRSLDAGLAESPQSGRPVLLLFQEIPGCATCVDFGAGPLSSPLLVDAIESEFVPVAIHNNRPGADAELLARFGEPACNFPVLRVLDAGGRDLLPRRDGIYGERGVADRLIAALEAAKRSGASYADVRVVRRRVEAIATREEHVTGVSYFDSYGLGVRVIVNGAWGFAAVSDVTPAAAQRAASEAVGVGAGGEAGAHRFERVLGPAGGGAQHEGG